MLALGQQGRTRSRATVSIEPMKDRSLLGQEKFQLVPHVVEDRGCRDYEAFHRGDLQVRLSGFHRTYQFGGSHMLRLIFSAIALAGVLETAQPAFADPFASTAADFAQTAASAAAQPAPKAPTGSSSSDATAPTSAVRDLDIASVGFGWG
jgi:hypothetical protein